jgi:hypothetical protein
VRQRAESASAAEGGAAARALSVVAARRRSFAGAADGDSEMGGSDSGSDTFVDALAGERGGTPRTRFDTFVRRGVAADEAESSSDDFDEGDEAVRDTRRSASAQRLVGRRSRSHGVLDREAKRHAAAEAAAVRGSARASMTAASTEALRKKSLSLPPSASAREDLLATMHAALKANAATAGAGGAAAPALPARPSQASDRQLQAAWANEVDEITMELEAETAKSGSTPDLLRGWLYKPDFGREGPFFSSFVFARYSFVCSYILLFAHIIFFCLLSKSSRRSPRSRRGASPASRLRRARRRPPRWR